MILKNQSQLWIDRYKKLCMCGLKCRVGIINDIDQKRLSKGEKKLK